MAELNSICVYCGSGTGADPAYIEAAEALGRNMAEAGVRLVYGGGSVGPDGHASPGPCSMPAATSPASSRISCNDASG